MFTMPETITFANNLTLTRIDTPFEPIEPSYVEVRALAYTACIMFNRMFGHAYTFNDVDRATMLQNNELYLNDFEGYANTTHTIVARTIAIDHSNRIAVQCWDIETGNVSAWYD